MPIIREVEGNLLDMFDAGEFTAIIHGCNCQQVMGAGIAQQIAQRYPLAATMDSRIKSKLGDLMVIPIGSQQAILNGYTQLYPGRAIDGENRLLAMHEVFTKANELSIAVQQGLLIKGIPLKFGIPLIGAGLAGGDWNLIESVINEVTPDMDITLVRYKP